MRLPDNPQIWFANGNEMYVNPIDGSPNDILNNLYNRDVNLLKQVTYLLNQPQPGYDGEGFFAPDSPEVQITPNALTVDAFHFPQKTGAYFRGCIHEKLGITPMLSVYTYVVLPDGKIMLGELPTNTGYNKAGDLITPAGSYQTVPYDKVEMPSIVSRPLPPPSLVAATEVYEEMGLHPDIEVQLTPLAFTSAYTHQGIPLSAAFHYAWHIPYSEIVTKKASTITAHDGDTANDFVIETPETFLRSKQYQLHPDVRARLQFLWMLQNEGLLSA